MHLLMIPLKLHKYILKSNANAKMCSKLSRAMSWAPYIFKPQTSLMSKKYPGLSPHQGLDLSPLLSLTPPYNHILWNSVLTACDSD